ncbi:energy transducer TonB [Gilvimarinus sp. F26214L]|uniref:energy transducer TonB n=1 Tax=Gilvimarinus sp. DZF01 TaxID=3461371 RepID=UPI0040457248
MNKKLTVLLLLLSPPLFAEENPQVEIFEGPIRKDAVRPSYPANEARSGSEGWVTINFMVAPDGTPFEPVVVGSEGSKTFREAALRALRQTEFEPAALDGKPVTGSSYIQYNFVMEENAGASRRFISLYKRLVTALDENKKEEAEQLIVKLSEHRPFKYYEASYLNLAKSFYAARYGSKLEELGYVEDALRNESHVNGKWDNFPSELLRSSRERLFILQVENQRYADAAESYKIIKKEYGKEAVERFTDTYEQILNLKTNDVAYSVPLVLNDEGYAFYELHKRGFYLEAENDVVQEVKLRCKAKYVFFGYEKDTEYEIPDSWGPCTVQVLGRADKSVRLVQF